MSERSLSELVAERLAITDKYKAWRMAKKETLARDWLDGAETEHARLSPLHDQLVKCVEALESFKTHDRVRGYPTGPEWIDLCRGTNQALTELRKLVEGK